MKAVWTKVYSICEERFKRLNCSSFSIPKLFQQWNKTRNRFANDKQKRRTFKPIKTNIGLVAQLVEANNYFNFIARFSYKNGVAQVGTKALLSAFRKLQEHIVRTSSKRIAFGDVVGKVAEAVEDFSVPVKVVPRFVKSRVRRIPFHTSQHFQHARTWRFLFSLSRKTNKRFAEALADELIKLVINPQTSGIHSKLAAVFKDIEKGKVYLKAPKVSPSLYKKLLPIIKQSKNQSWPKELWRSDIFTKLQVANAAKGQSWIYNSVKVRMRSLRQRIMVNTRFKSIRHKYIEFLLGFKKDYRHLIHV